MATAVPLEPSTMIALDRFVAERQFASRDEAIRTALHMVEDMDAGPLTPAELAAIDEGLAQARAGQLIPLEEVRAEMKRRFSADR